jgi:putative chitinase
MSELTLVALQRHWSHGNSIVPGLIEGIIAAAPIVFQKYGLNALAQAHFMGQASLESGCGTEMTENLSYTAGRLCAVWPHHFNAVNAAHYAHNPEKLGNFIYEPPLHNDLGNRPNSGDGFAFRGRGLSQVTGRAGYAKLGGKVSVDLITHPELVNDPAHALECGVADFVICGCLPYALADNLHMVTQHLNGGQTDADQRKVYTAIWKRELL